MSIIPSSSSDKKFQCRIEELPILADFVIAAFERDYADFYRHSPVVYHANYIVMFRKKQAEVIALINPRTITDDKKLITAHLHEFLDGLRQPLNKLEDYILLAQRYFVNSSESRVEDNPRNDSDNAELTTLPDDFGISRVRKEIANGDIEGLYGAMEILKTHIVNNYAKLNTIGYTEAQRDSFFAFWDKINSYNEEQNKKDNERDVLSEQNIVVCNSLWDIISEICNTGKTLYSILQPAKSNDYTIRTLLKRIRHEQPKPRFRTMIIKPDKIRIIKNIIPGSKIKNKGITTIALWNGKNSTQSPADHLLEPDTSWIIPVVWDIIITVKNMNSDKKGKIKIQAIGKNLS